jgi:hypothetical protein
MFWSLALCSTVAGASKLDFDNMVNVKSLKLTELFETTETSRDGGNV